jgi:hypothetical protein
MSGARIHRQMRETLRDQLAVPASGAEAEAMRLHLADVRGRLDRHKAVEDDIRAKAAALGRFPATGYSGTVIELGWRAARLEELLAAYATRDQAA